MVQLLARRRNRIAGEHERSTRAATRRHQEGTRKAPWTPPPPSTSSKITPGKQKHACYNYTLSDGDGDEGVSRAPTFKDRFEAADAKKKRVRQRFVE